MMIGVVADDITGSNDIGIMFAKNNYKTYIYSYNNSKEDFNINKEIPDVTILDTDSRFDSKKNAYNKVYKATLELKNNGVNRFFNKTCSVFRGNIGIEFDAMLDALKEEFAIVVLGFPKNGRQTIDNIHYVHGKKLEKSEFRNDPMHPMTESNLIKILQSQTDRKVAALNRKIVKQGSSILREQIKKMETRCNYLIIDVVDQDDLLTIAKAVQDYKVFCGSSALAEELPKVWGFKDRDKAKSGLPYNKELGIICAAGSLMPQTTSQIEYLKKKGYPVIEIDSLKLLDLAERKVLIDQLVTDITTLIKAGKDVLFHSSNQGDKVKKTKEIGIGKGLTKKEIARLVSGTIAEITYQVVEDTGQNRLLIAGGDTSAVVSNRLGIKGLKVWKEIKPGLPSCISLTKSPIMLVLKSGSFGEENFFELAINHLRSE